MNTPSPDEREYRDEFLYLTTTGWRSGNPHEIEIWYVEHDGAYYLCSEHREQSHWVQNIRQNPAVRFRVNGQIFSGTARIVAESETDLLAAVATRLDEKYEWSDGLYVELKPLASPV